MPANMAAMNKHKSAPLSAVTIFVARQLQETNPIYLTIIARKRACYRLILSRRGRRPSRLKLGDITQA